jgi:UDP-3-O-[3-hydroxymyristoyl] glucosamine N-acyltransferase
MLIANNKPICLIGYDNSTITQEAKFFMSKEFSGDIVVLSPDEFVNLNDKTIYQYGVAFTLDTEKRIQIIDIIETLNLDCIKYIHDSVVYYTDDPASIIGRGTFIAPHSTILLGAKIGNHCIIETYCLISHYVELKDNVQLHSGVMIAGKTTVGKNSVFNFKSTAINALTLCDNIEVGATSTITKSVTDSGYYVGSPARRIGARKIFVEENPNV